MLAACEHAGRWAALGSTVQHPRCSDPPQWFPPSGSWLAAIALLEEMRVSRIAGLTPELFNSSGSMGLHRFKGLNLGKDGCALFLALPEDLFQHLHVSVCRGSAVATGA